MNKLETEKEIEKENNAYRKMNERHSKSTNQRILDKKKEAAKRKTNRNSTSVETAIIHFKRAIKDGALYESFSCARLMFRRSVLKYAPSKYRKIEQELIRNIIEARRGTTTDWICQTCDAALKRSSIPALCLVNNLSLESIPHVLEHLTFLEQQIKSQILPFMKVITLHTGAQHKLSGQVVLVPSDLSKVTTSLPRNIASAQIITLALKRRLFDKHPYHQQLASYVKLNEEEVIDSEDEVDFDNSTEVQEELQNKASLNAVTCVQPALDATEKEQLQNSISLTTRKTFQSDISAGQLKDPGQLKRMISTDQLFSSFKNIRATPQYWQQMQLDMLAKLQHVLSYWISSRISLDRSDPSCCKSSVTL
ncbi:uncharacterized protein LOC132753479 [Ruditapes philippinarum]|uniref:uncharacterized protein LOC132753479 n=1 Tax=Ruditapes philippinarum TaxID=129788 RepID=UPI00295AD5DC|nr:uncharacterized protein LOC132753479 [Ruditapes philippinarum]